MKKHFTGKIAKCIHPGRSNKNVEQLSPLILKHQLLEKYYFTEKSNVAQRGKKEMILTFMNYPIL